MTCCDAWHHEHDDKPNACRRALLKMMAEMDERARTERRERERRAA